MTAKIKKNNFLIGVVLSFLFLLSGCVPVLIGAGAVGGYALSSDSARGRVSTSYPEIWDLCIETLEAKEADFLTINQARGHIKAVVYEHSVTIRIDSLSSRTQQLRVAARRYFMPRPQFAQEIFFEIVKDLE